MLSLSKTKLISSFAALNITQFLTALNDNYYKLILIFFLITIRGAEHSNTILSLAGAIFVIPFLLFASLSGSLADRFSKRSIIYATRFTEILTTSLALIAFFFHSVWGGYAILFFMAVQSTLFSPCKYGIIPEIVPKGKISQCNGIITATTYLAIILGTFLASFITEITHKNFLIAVILCILIAVGGLIASLGIEKTPAQAEKKKVSTHFISDIYRSLVRAKKRRYLQIVLIFGSYFLFMGSYTQLNIIPYTIQSLHLSAVHGGYLFLMTAIGIGLGSYAAGRLSGREVELGFVPLASLGVMLCFLCLYLFQHAFFIVVPVLILLGFFGGFYIVPVDAFIQVASPDEERGQNVATGNFLSFIGVIIASGLLALLGNGLSLTAAQGFLVMGLITLAMAVVLLLLFADQLLRLLVSNWSRFFLNIRVLRKGRIHQKEPVLLVVPRTSWLDTWIVMATLPRLIRYIIPIRAGKKKYGWMYRLLWLIPIDMKQFTPIGSPALHMIREELHSGNSLCLMFPTDLPATNLEDWESKLHLLLKHFDVPLLPIYISKPPLDRSQSSIVQLWRLRKAIIKISYGLPKVYT